MIIYKKYIYLFIYKFQRIRKKIIKFQFIEIIFK